mmetsp:Transcript_22286/g.27450  ORF Transcript_22286/g.27450 Transcript_22286/m.27450 type:complete len:421 (+) Transcript_22286:45-1307(+)
MSFLFASSKSNTNKNDGITNTDKAFLWFVGIGFVGYSIWKYFNNNKIIDYHYNEYRVINFSAGPSQLPVKVLTKVQKELLNYNNSGQSVMEMSHRSQEFTEIYNNAEKNLRELLNIPDNYSVFFVQGGATSVSSMIPLNFNIRNTGKSADFVITGVWSAKAAKEAQKYGNVNILCDTTKDDIPCTNIPDYNEWKVNDDSAYLHICINETVHGVQFHDLSFLDDIKIPIVADYSSCFMSEPINVNKFDIIYAGAQKNVGPAGVTILIIKNKYIGNADPLTPILYNFETYKKKSIPNTPPTWSIYVMSEYFKYIKDDMQGLKNMRNINTSKAALIYNEIDSDNFYNSPVNKNVRSIMNVRFNLNSTNLEKTFIDDAKLNGFINIKGYRTLGGIRVSIYNAQTLNSVKKFVNFMKQFRKKHQK